jgi:hypothetical protein
MCRLSNPLVPFNLTPIEQLLLRVRHPDVPRPVGVQASDLASLREACARAECETTTLSAKADAAHSAAAAAEAARHALALEAGEARRREAELLRENARLAGEYRFGLRSGVSPGEPKRACCNCTELKSNAHSVTPSNSDLSGEAAAERGAALEGELRQLQGDERQMGDEIARLHALERQLGEQVASLGAREAELNHQVGALPSRTRRESFYGLSVRLVGPW